MDNVQRKPLFSNISWSNFFVRLVVLLVMAPLFFLDTINPVHLVYPDICVLDYMSQDELEKLRPGKHVSLVSARFEPCNVRFVIQQIGPSFGRVYDDRQCCHNIYAALCMRIGREPPQRNCPEINFDLFIRSMTDWIILAYGLNCVYEPLTEEQFLKGKPKRMRNRYMKGKLQAGGETWPIFIKQLVSCKTPKLGGKIRWPRIVVDVDPSITVEVGPWLAAIERECHKIPGWAKNWNSTQISDWVSPRLLTLWWGDFSKFENSITKPIIDNEQYFLDRIIGGNELSRVSTLAKHWSVRYSIDRKTRHKDILAHINSSCRPSGIPWTAVMNNFTAHTIHHMAHALHCYRNKTPYVDCGGLRPFVFPDGFAVNMNIDYINNGDDCLRSSRFAPPDASIYSSLGFEFEWAKGADFCRSKPVNVSPDRVYMVRKPEEFLTRFGFSLRVGNKNFKQRMALMAQICVAYSNTFDGIPIYSALITKVYNFTKLFNRGPVDPLDLPSYTLRCMVADGVDVSWKEQTKPTQISRSSFAEQFGIEESLQIMTETEIAAMRHPFQRITSLDDYLSEVRGPEPPS